MTALSDWVDSFAPWTGEKVFRDVQIGDPDPLPVGRAWRARARAMGHSRALIRHVAGARRGKHFLSLVSWSDVALLDRAF